MPLSYGDVGQGAEYRHLCSLQYSEAFSRVQLPATTMYEAVQVYSMWGIWFRASERARIHISCRVNIDVHQLPREDGDCISPVVDAFIPVCPCALHVDAVGTSQ